MWPSGAAAARRGPRPRSLASAQRDDDRVGAARRLEDQRGGRRTLWHLVGERAIHGLPGQEIDQRELIRPDDANRELRDGGVFALDGKLQRVELGSLSAGVLDGDLHQQEFVAGRRRGELIRGDEGAGDLPEGDDLVPGLTGLAKDDARANRA